MHKKGPAVPAWRYGVFPPGREDFSSPGEDTHERVYKSDADEYSENKGFELQKGKTKRKKAGKPVR
jgi:hypothetical protein